jgi:glucokinase
MNNPMEGFAASVALETGSSAQLGLPWLLADIGGTNARFGWVHTPGQGVEHIQTLPVADHAEPADAAEHYLSLLQQGLGKGFVRPRRAAWAVATAIHGDTVAMTNSTWRFSRRHLQQTLGVEQLLVLNDFEALALSLPKLSARQYRPWAASPSAQGVVAVVGPGTGLGVGAAVQTAHGWAALPGEGGHATLAPMDNLESELLYVVRREYPHVSAERLLSGIGLPVLHGALAQVLGHAGSPLSAEQVVERGVSRLDNLCHTTLDTFCALLGGFCGNVALTYGARGGLYVGGGIVPRLGELFFESRFRERFEAKGRFQAYLQDIPTALITDTLAALTGAAFALEQLAAAEVTPSPAACPATEVDIKPAPPG